MKFSGLIFILEWNNNLDIADIVIYRLKMYEGIFLEINISFDERIIIGDYENCN